MLCIFHLKTIKFICITGKKKRKKKSDENSCGFVLFLIEHIIFLFLIQNINDTNEKLSYK